MTFKRNGDNIYSMSKLAKKAGLGSRITWRKIIARPQFAEMFRLISENPTRVYVETDLSKEGLQSIYKKHLDLVYQEHKEHSYKGVQMRLAKKKQLEEAERQKLEGQKT